MKALVYTGRDRVEYQSWPDPDPRPSQAVVAVEATGICGSDMAGFHGRSSRRVPPLILGHEVVGVVRSAPPSAAVRPGDRVVANPLQSCGRCDACRSGRENQCADWKLLGMDTEQGGLAELVAVEADNLTVIPSDMPAERAAFAEPLANTMHIMGIASREDAATTLLMGAGTQGILALMVARHLGYPRIAAADTDPARRELARRLGADPCLDPADGDLAAAVRRWSPGGVDLAIEAVGVDATRSAAISAVRKGGRVVLLGLHDQVSPTDYATVVRNEINLIGSFAYTRRDFAAALEVLTKREVDPSPYSRTMPLQRGQDAFEFLSGAPGATLKVLLAPQGERGV